MRQTIPLLILGMGCQSKTAEHRTTDGETLLSTCAISALEPGQLDTDGTLIVDQHGRRILLRGINTGGRSKFAPFSPFDYAEGGFEDALNAYMDKPAQWGLNVLRVPFSWDAMEPERGVDDEEFLDRYDRLLDAAAARGLWTIVDFHQDIYSERYCGDGFPIWASTGGDEPHHDCESWFSAYLLNEDMRTAWDEFWENSTGIQDDFKSMWTRMVTRQWGRDGVIGFEIMNEPGWGHRNMFEWEADTLTPFYSDMISLIHSHAPEAFVLFDGTGMDAVTVTTSLNRPEGDRIIYAPHFYDPSVFLEGEQEGVEVAESYNTLASIGAEWDIPVLVGEFGTKADDEGARQYATDNWNALDAAMLHGTWWEYSASTELWNHENLSVVDADLTERPQLVEPLVRAYPHAIDGELEHWFYDPTTATATLSVSASTDGITEVMIPERLYGGDPVVSGTGACFNVEGQRLLLQATEDRFEVTISPR